jgi:hypothetical protein
MGALVEVFAVAGQCAGAVLEVPADRGEPAGELLTADAGKQVRARR